jgi:hypothetical protein
MGNLSASQTINNLTITIHSNGLPDYDKFKWVMSRSGAFTATETTDAGGPLELHLFKIVNGSIVDVGDSTGGANPKSLSSCPNAREWIVGAP